MVKLNIIETNMNCTSFLPRCKAECCSDSVPFSKEWFDAHKHKSLRDGKEIDFLNAVVFKTDSGKCTFLNDDYSCSVYEDRPDLCKKFGDETHPFLRCSFQRKDGSARSRQEKRRIEKENLKKIYR